MTQFNHFPQIIAELQKGGEQIVSKAAFDTQATAQTLAPVDTGALKNSIFARAAGVLRWIVGTNIEYGPYQEYGTVYQSGKPYLRPGAERVRPGYVAAWAAFLKGLGR